MQSSVSAILPACFHQVLDGNEEEDTCMSYEEEDTCMPYEEEEDTCMSVNTRSQTRHACMRTHAGSHARNTPHPDCARGYGRERWSGGVGLGEEKERKKREIDRVLLPLPVLFPGSVITKCMVVVLICLHKPNYFLFFLIRNA